MTKLFFRMVTVATAVACLSPAATLPGASRIFILPGAGGGTTGAIYTPDPFLITNLALQPGAFALFARPDASKFYAVSPSGPIDILNNTGGRTGSITFSGATAAVLTPDGRRLVAGTSSGSVFVFDTSSDAALGSPASAGSTVVDIAPSLDSSRAFVLTAGQVLAVDTSSGSAGTPVTLAGPARALTAAPNGLLYVSVPNAVLEFDIRTGTPLLRSTITLLGDPGKPAFTPDGRYLLVPNRAPGLGQAAIFLTDLGTKTRPIQQIGGVQGAAISRVLPVSGNRVLAFSETSQALYDITLQPLSAQPFQTQDSARIYSAAVTNESPAAQYLFLTTQNQLLRLELATGNTVPATDLVGGGTVALGIPPSTAASQIFKFNDNQTVSAGGSALPVVVRLTDGNGRPAQGVTVVFASSTGQFASPATSAEGYAQFVLANPTATGTITVTAAAIGVPTQTFTIAVTPNTGTNSIAITAGQGQLVNTITVAGSPLIVTVRDSNGTPLPGQSVNFAIVTGTGTLQIPNNFSGSGPTASVTTGSNGQGIVNFIPDPGAVQAGQSFAQDQITASIASGASVSFILTIYPITGFNGQAVPPPIVQADQNNNPPFMTFTGKAGSTITGALRFIIASYLGQAIPGVGVRLVNAADPSQPASATCAGGTPLSGQNGVVVCDLVLGSQTGISQFTARIGESVNFTYNLNIQPGATPAAIHVEQGNAQSGLPGQTLPVALRVQVVDSTGNAVASVPVSWQVTAGSATLVNPVTTTASDGRATAGLLLGNTPGAVTVTVTSGAAIATFTETIGSNSNAAVITSPQPGSTLPSTSVTFIWSTVPGASTYLLQIGNSPGAADLYQIETSLTSAIAPALPGDGRTVYVRLSTKAGGSIVGLSDYTYAAFSPTATGTALRFVAVAPCRLADTRLVGGPLVSGTSRDFPVPAGGCAIPATAQAYSLNVTVVPVGALSYLTLWPTGSARPLVSTLNSFDGRIKANAAIVPAGPGGSISVFATDTTHVVLDISGYFVPAAGGTGLTFVPVTTCRAVDTRRPPTPFGGNDFGGPMLAAGSVRSFALPQSGCGLPADAQAYSLNFTAVPRGPLGYLTTWPAGSAQPFVSTLNAPTGVVTANAAIVPAGAGGAISVYVTDSSDLVIDVNGYFSGSGAGGSSFYTLRPCRVADTRNQQGTFGGPPLSAASARTFPITQSPCGAPTSATAYSLNATVVPPASLPYLTLWAAGSPTPVASTLNAIDGSVTANAAIVPAGSGGAINAFAFSGTNLILDINGYFAP